MRCIPGFPFAKTWEFFFVQVAFRAAMEGLGFSLGPINHELGDSGVR